MQTVITILKKLSSNALVQRFTALYLCTRSWLVFNKH